jgi:hypothetical protein
MQEDKFEAEGQRQCGLMNVIVNGNVTKYKIYAKKVTNYCD